MPASLHAVGIYDECDDIPILRFIAGIVIGGIEHLLSLGTDPKLGIVIPKQKPDCRLNILEELKICFSLPTDLVVQQVIDLVPRQPHKIRGQIALIQA